MALTDQVIMPGSDYQAICDATRSLTGTSGTLKSSEVADKILSYKKTKYLLKPVLTLPEASNSYPLHFITGDGAEFTGIIVDKNDFISRVEYTSSSGSRYVYNDNNFWNDDEIVGTEKNNRRITVLGDVPVSTTQSWLNANTEISSNEIKLINPNRAISIKSNGTQKILSEAYDGMAQVTLTVDVPSTVSTETKTVALNMASGNQIIDSTSGKYMTQVTVKKPSTLVPSNIKRGVNIGGIRGTFEGGADLPFTWLTTVSTDNGILSFSFTGYYNTIIAKISGTSKILTAVFGNDLKASFVVGSEGSVLCTSSGFSVYAVGNRYNCNWNICDSSGSVWYEGTYDIYGCKNG